MTSSQRLASAKATDWMKGYSGKNLVHGYRHWFGVDLLCAISELRKLKVAISTDYETQVRRTLEQQVLQKKLRREAKESQQYDDFPEWQDYDFAVVQDSTPGHYATGTNV